MKNLGLIRYCVKNTADLFPTYFFVAKKNILHWLHVQKSLFLSNI
jgi:hypothetical protein